MKRRPKITVTAEAVEPAYDVPTCAECGNTVTASRTEYDMSEPRPRLVETYTPCGCRSEFPMPTVAQNLAAAELAGIERVRNTVSARSYAVATGTGFTLLVLTVGALLAYGIWLPWGIAQTWNLTAIGAVALFTQQSFRLWRLQRLHDSAVQRLCDDEDTGSVDE